MDSEEARATLKAHPLRIGVSTRSLFELDEEDRIFREEGVDAYVQYQRDHEEEILGEGAAFQTIKRILALNEDPKSPYVEVVLMSKNSPDLSLRAFNSAKAYNLPIRHGSFTSGRPLAPYLPAWGIDLFLSNDGYDVRSAAASGAAAALLGKRPPDIWTPPSMMASCVSRLTEMLSFSAQSPMRFMQVRDWTSSSLMKRTMHMCRCSLAHSLDSSKNSACSGRYT